MRIRGETEEPSPLWMSLWVMTDGEVVIYLGGALDISSAEVAFGHIGDLIDRSRGPVVVDLSGLDDCDAHGLRALVRMRGYAERSGIAFQFASPRESLVKIMRITGLDLEFPVF